MENKIPAKIPIAEPNGGANELPAKIAPINPTAAIIVKSAILPFSCCFRFFRFISVLGITRYSPVRNRYVYVETSL